MAITANTIDHTTLERLVEAGAINGASIIGEGKGWGVVVKYGMTERVLAARRGSIREFKNFDTIVAYLKKIGVPRFSVDATNYDPTIAEVTKRSNAASLRMKAAHEAAAYNKWFLAEVEAGIREADDPNTVMVPHAVVKEDMAKQRKQLLARIAAGNK